MDHVRTQMPYALVVAGVSLALGYLPAGFGVSPWILNAMALAALVLILRFFGRSTRPEDLAADGGNAKAS
jgi:Na+/H+ antiporter NhaC